MMKTFFDTTSIASKTITNRFFVAPMTRVSADPTGIPTNEMLHYYSSFATGGFGGIITEGLYTDNLYSKSYPNQPGIINEEQILSWKKITSEVHKNDTLFIAQLMHAGSISQILPKTKAPSKIIPLGEKMPHYGGGTGAFPIPEEMNETDLDNVKTGFVSAARNARKAGFDGIELHAANGYLLDQFITPYLNLRTDRYGGNVENRLRIIDEIIHDIKEKVSQDFIIGLRISEGKVNNISYRWEEGSETAIAILRQIEKMPINYLHIAAEHHGWEEDCLYDDGTSLTGLAKDILNVPVIANGKLNDLKVAQKLLDTNQADLFAIGKYALSNPDFVTKIKNGEELTSFDPKSLYPNPSLFSSEKFQKFLANHELA